ncbi:MAG: hypothetical protein AAGJ35_04465, partial [Myxococcota bacterium]
MNIFHGSQKQMAQTPQNIERNTSPQHIGVQRPFILTAAFCATCSTLLLLLIVHRLQRQIPVEKQFVPQVRKSFPNLQPPPTIRKNVLRAKSQPSP